MRPMFALALAILMLGTVLGGVSAAPPTRPGRAVTAIGKVRLSPGQKAKLQDYLRASKKQTTDARQALMLERKRLRGFYDSYKLNTAQAKASISKINRLQLDLLNHRLDRRIRVRSVLNPGQFVEYRKIMRSIPRRPRPIDEDMRPVGPPPHRPRLDLNARQQADIERMWRSQAAKSGNIVRAMQRDLLAIDRLYANYRVDERAAHRLISSVNRSQMEMVRLGLERQIELRRILTEPQFRALTQHVKKSFKPPLNRPRRR